MRLASLSVLLMSTVGLSACGGSGGSTLIEMNNLCGTTCATSTQLPAPPKAAVNGQALPPPSTVNTGNTTALVTGDTTLVLEGGVVINTRNNPGRSVLTPDTGTTEDTKSAKLSIDTKNSARNSSWPVPKTMAWTKFGSQNEISSGISTDRRFGTNGTVIPSLLADPANPDISGSTQLAGATYNEYRVRSQDKDVPYDESLQIWTWGKSYAAQYRDVTSSGAPAGHQAWVYGGANGIKKSTAEELPTTGSLSFSGQYTSTVTTSGFLEKDLIAYQTMKNNGEWSSFGDANFKATFSATGATFTGTLDPDIWRKHRNEERPVDGAAGFAYIDIDAARAMEGLLRANPALALDERNFGIDELENFANYRANAEFLDVPIILNGTIGITASTSAPAAPPPAGSPPAPAPTENNIVGTTQIGKNYGWITNTSTDIVYGSVFGTAATGYEVTGVFNAEGVVVNPFGGNIAINDDRRAIVHHSGVFHVEQCAAGSPNCPP
jgi:hypothetical protein